MLQAVAADDSDVLAHASLSPPSSTPKKITGRSDSCPPASPAFTEQIAAAKDEVIYLIGGYARYDRP